MKIHVLDDKPSLGRAAASHAAALISAAIRSRGRARILVATGASQIEFLAALTVESGIDWSRVEMFHLDEYVGLSVDHRASFRGYLLDRLINKVGIRDYHLLHADTDPEKTCREVGERLREAPVDVAFAGIGENGHLAFNDPPADFETTESYRVVDLDEVCREQQVGEGWFDSLAEVPLRAISISVRQLLTAASIISVVPDERKAAAVKACLQGPVSPMYPASILQTHPDVTVYLDREAASLLDPTQLEPSTSSVS